MFSFVRSIRTAAIVFSGVFSLGTMASIAHAQSYDLTCYDAVNEMCGEYSFSDAATLESFMGQCQSMGSEASEGHNCPSGGTGCLQTASGMAVITWVYNMDAASVEQACVANGGQAQ